MPYWKVGESLFPIGKTKGTTRPITILITLFALAMAGASAMIRDGDSAVPLGYLPGAITFAVCTTASLRWQTVYRIDPTGGAKRRTARWIRRSTPRHGCKSPPC